MAKLYFTNRMKLKLDRLQMAILLGMGLQHKEIDLLHVSIVINSPSLTGLFLCCTCPERTGEASVPVTRTFQPHYAQVHARV